MGSVDHALVIVIFLPVVEAIGEQSLNGRSQQLGDSSSIHGSGAQLSRLNEAPPCLASANAFSHIDLPGSFEHPQCFDHSVPIGWLEHLQLFLVLFYRGEDLLWLITSFERQMSDLPNPNPDIRGPAESNQDLSWVLSCLFSVTLGVISMTVDTYGHFTSGANREALERSRLACVRACETQASFAISAQSDEDHPSGRQYPRK